MISTLLSSILFSISHVSSQAIYPPGCSEATFPNSEECIAKNWFLGADARDPCAPIGPYPVSGEQVAIQDAANFCLNLPNPNSPYLKRQVYAGGLLPTILQGEGYAQSFCMGSITTPGSLPMPAGGVRSAHVIKGASKNGKRYIQISGTFDCDALQINCTASAPGAYDDGGQYDNVPFVNCGKLPYSGVDTSKHPGMVDYVMQGGNGIFCMRICEAGSQQEDPCNVKDDTKGCLYTMGITTFNVPGFDEFDQSTGQTTTFNVSLPPLKSSTTTTTSRSTPTGGIIQNGAFSLSNDGVIFKVAGSIFTSLLAFIF